MHTLRQQRDVTTLMIALGFAAFITGYWLGSFDNTANRVTAMFTIVLAAVAIQQVRISFQTNQITRTIERGFLSVRTGAVIECEGRHPRNYRIRLRLRNTGKTPIHLERLIVYVGKISQEQPGVLRHEKRVLGEYLAPGDHFSTDEYDVFIEDNLSAPNDLDRRHALIIGAVDYTDEFGVQRTRAFGYEFGISQMSLNIVGLRGEKETISPIKLRLSLPDTPGYHYDRER